MRYLLLMINKVRFCRNDRLRYVKTRRYREQTRSWNNFYRIRANIMHKHYMVDRRPLVDVVRNEMHVVFELEAHDALSTISTTATASTEEKMYDSCDDVSIEMQYMSPPKEEKVGEVDTSSSS